MLVLTGGAGFIGSCLLQKLNENGISDIIVVDNLASTEKWKNLVGKRFEMYLQKQEFLMLMSQGKLEKIDAIIHLGACSCTTEKNADYLMANNLNYTKALAAWCLKNGKKMWYASSAATYGDGSLGYSDDDALTPKLRPLNMYGYSKQLFDEWLIKNKCQNKLTGFRFFNVFGPNEYHKDSMRSMILKAFPRARDEHKISLFASDRPDYKDG
ncbi:NAD-dependent epimerase/dehydratase family protein, partial [bacterium]|nr:NAD-dependent epimerase/dehydratase family protein [bacterium]